MDLTTGCLKTIRCVNLHVNCDLDPKEVNLMNKIRFKNTFPSPIINGWLDGAFFFPAWLELVSLAKLIIHNEEENMPRSEISSRGSRIFCELLFFINYNC